MKKTKGLRPNDKNDEANKICSFDDVKDIRNDREFANSSVGQFAEDAIAHLKEEMCKVEALPEQEIKVAAISFHLVFHDPREPDRAQMEHRIITVVLHHEDPEMYIRLFQRLADENSPDQEPKPRRYEGIAYR